jgi:RNA polymerase sigma factor (TIGR02999 family)
VLEVAPAGRVAIPSLDKRVDAPDEADVSGLLRAWSGGEPGALDRLIPLVYQELRSLAAGYLRREKQEHTLEPTAVLHEAYLRLVDKTHPRWEGRVHFFAVAAQIMRRVLVDHARARQAAKRGGEAVKVPLEEEQVGLATGPDPALLSLDEALDRLARLDPRKSRTIELRYFGGLTHDEVARLLGVSAATVRLDTRLARAWLSRELRREAAP